MLETLIAVAIMGTAVVAFLSALSTASMSMGTVSESEVARNLAVSQLEQVRAAAFVPSPGSYSVIAPPAGYSISLDVLPVSGGDTNIQLIRTTVSVGGEAVVYVEDIKVNR
ncbi:MAG: hypothetical protein V3S82_04580 [Dehalococcoidia bacterium]